MGYVSARVERKFEVKFFEENLSVKTGCEKIAALTRKNFLVQRHFLSAKNENFEVKILSAGKISLTIKKRDQIVQF